MATQTETKTVAPVQGLSEDQIAQFDRDGVLVIEDFLDQSVVYSLLSEAHHLLGSFDVASHPGTKFTTEDKSHVNDGYFLSSGDQVRFFFEEGAFDPNTNKLIKPKEAAINKIGHFLHGLNDKYRQVTLTKTNASIAQCLGFTDPRVLQSMLICKQPQIGGAVPPHQDSTFLYTNPPSALGFWIALEDAGEGNGGLSFAKGSHKRWPVEKRFVRQLGEDGVVTAGMEGMRSDEATFPVGTNVESKPKSMDDETWELAKVKAGSLVLIHGNVLHRSEKNTGSRSRYAYAFHLVDFDRGYDERNWLQMQAGERAFTKLYQEA